MWRVVVFRRHAGNTPDSPDVGNQSRRFTVIDGEEEFVRSAYNAFKSSVSCFACELTHNGNLIEHFNAETREEARFSYATTQENRP